jgi:hypothetical protein
MNSEIKVGAEYAYPNIFQLSSLRIPYFPIFHSWAKENSSDQNFHDSPGYSFDEIQIQIENKEYSLPNVFTNNPLPIEFQERLSQGELSSNYSKCRFEEYKTSFAPKGYQGRLKITLSKTNYLDYLK